MIVLLKYQEKKVNRDSLFLHSSQLVLIKQIKTKKKNEEEEEEKLDVYLFCFLFL